jgi:hypothetical protein
VLQKFPQTHKREETLFNLYYCYKKIGDEENAQRVLRLLTGSFPNGPFTARAAHPDTVGQATENLRINATHEYEKIYLTFIEGRFEEALAMKKTADSVYGDKYWTPQLLYIEAVYFIHTHQDQQAKNVLNSIIFKWARTPMSAKAATMLDVLNRRRQIEDYLTHLNITRLKDDEDINVDTTTTKPRPVDNRPRLVRNDSNMLVKDTTSAWAKAKAREAALAGIRNNNVITMDSGKLANLQQLKDSLQQAMIKAKNDSLQTALLKHRSDSVAAAMQKIKDSTAQLAAKLRNLNSVFALTPDKPHSVIMVLDRVDPVYVSEAANAFNRYNTETYYSLQLTAQNAALSDSLKLLVIGNFADAKGALDYYKNVKAMAPRAIIPWMPAGKYRFLIISATNLELLLSNKDMPAYLKFLSAAYPGVF